MNLPKALVLTINIENFYIYKFTNVKCISLEKSRKEYEKRGFE